MIDAPNIFAPNAIGFLQSSSLHDAMNKNECNHVWRFVSDTKHNDFKLDFNRFECIHVGEHTHTWKRCKTRYVSSTYLCTHLNVSTIMEFKMKKLQAHLRFRAQVKVSYRPMTFKSTIDEIPTRGDKNIVSCYLCTCWFVIARILLLRKGNIGNMMQDFYVEYIISNNSLTRYIEIIMHFYKYMWFSRYLCQLYCSVKSLLKYLL